jgi:16S rRNA (guanine527-N7)-methyltransferase
VFADELRRRLAGILELSASQVATLQAHYELLCRWNRALNLTTITDLEGAVERHYCESLFLAAHLPNAALRVADVGSGAGFPGFPLAVLRLDCSVTLIESRQRKSVFLREATRKLANVQVLAVRAEKVGERFDWAVARAVSYQDLAPILKKLAPNVALLMGAEAPPDPIGFVWDEAIALPWGKQRFLRTASQTSFT